jgi:hypothetical protein
MIVLKRRTSLLFCTIIRFNLGVEDCVAIYQLFWVYNKLYCLCKQKKRSSLLYCTVIRLNLGFEDCVVKSQLFWGLK